MTMPIFTDMFMHVYEHIYYNAFYMLTYLKTKKLSPLFLMTVENYYF